MEGDTSPNAPPLGASILAPSVLRSSCPPWKPGAPADLELATGLGELTAFPQTPIVEFKGEGAASLAGKVREQKAGK